MIVTFLAVSVTWGSMSTVFMFNFDIVVFKFIKKIYIFYLEAIVYINIYLK
jgi:hypothetical protein